jgi:NAD(P)-dependent dehydrogenase (short-subunit alcohol dehydrogenase family)
MIVLVTGTSSGIGQATVARLGAAGHTVFAGRLDGASSAPPPGVSELPLDVRSDESVAAFVEAALARSGRIDALVNNAAYGLSGSLEETTIAEAQHLLDTNFFGAVRTMRALLPHFRQRGRGRIVNISSGAGFTAEPFAGWYTVSKFAVEGFSETLWHEVRPFGVRVSLVQPGWCRTNIVRAASFAAQPVADYDPWRKACLEAASGFLEAGMPPDRVARCVQRVLEARRPRLRYRVGADVTTSFWSRRFLPAGLFHVLVHRYYRLHQPQRPGRPGPGERR